MRKIFLTILTVFLFNINNSTAEGKGNEMFPRFRGYELKTDFKVYNPDNLWDYINGGAYTYLNFKFVDLHIAEYTKGGIVIKAEIYKHENSIYAFGMYAQERAPGYNFVKIGVQGYAENTLVNFVKGQYYVKVICNDGNESTGKVLTELARAIEENLQGSDKMPEMFSRFPAQGKTANSESYISTEFLGYGFMPGVYVTTYEGEEGRFRLFIVDAASDKTASEVISKLKGKADSSKKKKGILTVHDPYNGTILLYQSDNLIYGCADNCDPELFLKFSGE